MSDNATRAPSEGEEDQVDEYANVPTSVISEAIRREGEHELSRRAWRMPTRC